MAQRSAMLNNAAIITGIINYDLRKDEYFNSLIVLGKESADATDGEYYYNNSNRYYKNFITWRLPQNQLKLWHDFVINLID